MLIENYKVEIENALGKFIFYYDKDFINDHEDEFKEYGTSMAIIRLWLESRGFDNLEDIIMETNVVNSVIVFDYEAMQKAYESLKSIKLENLIIM